MARNNIDFENLTLGVCYYPEHWDKSMWLSDLTRMKECGINVVRIAEFAWNYFEPSEGVYTFEFFDEFMDLAQKEGMKVIFCTPTATAPIWLSEKYPEILNADIDGNKVYHGTRRHNNLNSKIYREFCKKITEKLAEHYCKYENVIGWQLDNEINCERATYYSESDHIAFREFLKNEFGTLDNLNKEMGTVFWNQTYTNWNEVYLTRRTNALGITNPHMALMEKRFISDTVISFFKIQADIIKKYRKDGEFITTNGIFSNIDYHKLTDEVLDFITYDNYPNFSYGVDVVPEKSNGLKDRNKSVVLTTIRSISNVFGIMEQQSGGGGWDCRMQQPMPKPGQMRLWTLQAIAHGADFISYFRWRTCTFGTEIYWHGLNDYSNKENRRIRELKQINEELTKIQKLAKSEYQASVALIKDYDNMWEADIDIWSGGCRNISDNGWFMALQKRHIPFDHLYINDNLNVDELSKYKVLIYTHPTIMTKKRADLLKKFVENGGKLIVGCRAGMKEINGKCETMVLPGYLSDIFGCEVLENTILSPYDDKEFIKCGSKTASAPYFNDVLEVTDGEVVGTYVNNHYDGLPAIIRKKSGNGVAYYVGSAFLEDTCNMVCDLAEINTEASITEIFELPENVEIAIRKKDDKEYIFIINYDNKSVKINIKKPILNLLTQKEIMGETEISAYDVLILEK